MKSFDQNQLLQFHFGGISDADRQNLERELLTDPELLVEFLDLKRSLEASESFPSRPSPSVWLRLQQHTSRRQKIWWGIGLSLATTAVASLLLFFSVHQTPVVQSFKVDNKTLTDSSQTDFDHPNFF